MNVGVIGAGWWGKNIINTLEKISKVDEVHIFDLDSSLYSRYEANAKARFAQSIDEIFGNPAIEAVCIVTPPPTHYALSKAALEAGKHVLVEKPPAQNVAEIREVAALAEKLGKVYVYDAVFLFLEPVGILYDLLKSGRVSTPRLVQSFRHGDEFRREGNSLARLRKVMYGNGIDVITDLFYHDAGVLFHLFENMKLKGVRKTCSYHPTLCDSALLSFEANGTKIESSVSWSYTGKRRGISIYTDTHIVEYDAFSPDHVVKVFDIEALTSEDIPYADNPPLTALLEYFITAIEDGITPFNNHVLMTNVTQLMEEIQHVN